MSEKPIVSTRRVITIAGSFIALLIGSGFATGQEILQYYSSYGWSGFLGVLLTFILMTYVGVELIATGYREKFEYPNDIYAYYAGNLIGKFFDWFSVFFIFLSVIVMFSGAGATVLEQFNLPTWAGVTGMAAIVMLVAILGLGKIVDVVGNIGPVIVVLAILVGVVSVFINWGNLQAAPETMQGLVDSGEVLTASNSWWMAAFSYVGFCLLWLAAFLSQVGATSNSEKEAKLGAFSGSAAFCLGVLVMAAGILLGIVDFGGSQIPALMLAREIHPVFGTLFSITILLGIFTTAVPLLWTVVSKFAKDGTGKYRSLTIAIAVLAWFIAMFLQFDTLVNVVYVLNGYVGFIMIIIMLYRTFRRMTTK